MQHAAQSLDLDALYTITAAGFSATADALPWTPTPTASGSSPWSALRQPSRPSGPVCSSSPRSPPTSSGAPTAWRSRAASSGASSPGRPSGRGRPRSPSCPSPEAGTPWCTPGRRSLATRRTPSCCWRNARRRPPRCTTASWTSEARSPARLLGRLALAAGPGHGGGRPPPVGGRHRLPVLPRGRRAPRRPLPGGGGGPPDPAGGGARWIGPSDLPAVAASGAGSATTGRGSASAPTGFTAPTAGTTAPGTS